MGVFSVALEELASRGGWYREPESFVGYLARNGLSVRRVAAAISVDSVSQLDSELRRAHVMVFRLGVDPGGRNTQFALAKAESADMRDYFLLDDQLFRETKPELFIPAVSHQALFAFSLIPTFTETSLVNLAVFSGLLGHALDLDPGAPLSAPATGQSTYTFSFSPGRNGGPVWQHCRGQVEVDAVMTGYRGGRPIAVIVESKGSSNAGSLAKHKLLYPYLALRPSIPDYMPVLLVYMRACEERDGFHFRIAEYEAQRNELSLAAMACPNNCRVRHLVLPRQLNASRSA